MDAHANQRHPCPWQTTQVLIRRPVCTGVIRNRANLCHRRRLRKLTKIRQVLIGVLQPAIMRADARGKDTIGAFPRINEVSATRLESVSTVAASNACFDYYLPLAGIDPGKHL